jgi:PAS domain S-box-containing protein
MPAKYDDPAIFEEVPITVDGVIADQREVALFKLHNAIFNSANLSSIATDEKGVIQSFNVGAERMLGYSAIEVVDKITPADISDPQEVIARAKALSLELSTPITPDFEALVSKASRGIEDIYELTYIRKDGTRFPAAISVTALRDDPGGIIGYLLIGADNTPHKQAEKALLKAGALQNAIFNSANFSSIATDREGVIQVFNVGAERMLGYSAVEVVDGVTLADISDPQEVIARAKTLSLELSIPVKPGFEALVSKAARGIEDIYELTYIRKDGSCFPAVVSVTALRDDAGGIAGYLFIGTDNTARKRAEEALLKTRALQTAVFNSANFSSIATDQKGVIQLFNVGAECMLGYSANEVVDRITPADISDSQEIIARASALSLELSIPVTPGFDALASKAARGIEDIFELTYIRKDGSPCPAVVSVTALRDDPGGIVGYLLIGADNAARKQAEAEQKLLDQRLREHQFYTRSLIESNIDALITADPAGIITDVNQRMEALTGCAREELIGAPFQNCFTDPERAQAGIGQALTAGKITGYELTARARDGKETVVSCNVTTYRGPDRKLRGVFAAARDVSEHKRVEIALQEKNGELERAKAAADVGITERTADLVRTNKELEAFSYSVSHDLRAPLRHLDGFAQLLRKSCYEKMDAPGQHYLDKISNSARKMGQLIDDLLAFSRLMRTEVLRTSVSLQLLLEEVRQDMEPDLAGRNVVWIIGELPIVYGDRSMLRQVFVNLLSNAVKYTRNRPEARIEIGCAGKSGEETTIFVRDNGAGFEMQYIGKLFEVFQRLHTGEYEGTGIGLATVRRIVERHGGRVWAEGAVGKGATFYCSLRLAVGTDGVAAN